AVDALLGRLDRSHRLHAHRSLEDLLRQIPDRDLLLAQTEVHLSCSLLLRSLRAGIPGSPPLAPRVPLAHRSALSGTGAGRKAGRVRSGSWSTHSTVTGMPTRMSPGSTPTRS